MVPWFFVHSMHIHRTVPMVLTINLLGLNMFANARLVLRATIVNHLVKQAPPASVRPDFSAQQERDISMPIRAPLASTETPLLQ